MLIIQQMKSAYQIAEVDGYLAKPDSLIGILWISVRMEEKVKSRIGLKCKALE
jgi:hypothetical protein